MAGGLPAGTSSLSNEELRLIYQLKAEGYKQRVIDERVGRPVKSAYLRASKNGALAAALADGVVIHAPSAKPAERAAEALRAIVAGDDGPTITGVTAAEHPDPEKVWAKAEAIWLKQQAEAERRQSQVIRFAHGPACIVFMADLHLGGQGVDYPRIKREAELARDIPNCGIWLAGDVIDNFIWQWCAGIRHHTEITIPEEYVLAKTVLDIVGPRLVASVGGNHCAWGRKASGYDILRDMTARVRPDVLYDADDCLATVEVGGSSTRIRVRHKWRGSSIYNSTHGQERAARWDEDADVYVGAHTHTEGAARSFTVGGDKKLAIQLGAYKRIDDYARVNGFSKPDGATAVALIIDEKGRRVAVEYLEMAAEIMHRMMR